MLKELRPRQVQAIQMLRQSLMAGKRRPMIQAPTGFGKCLGRGTPILLFDGTVKAVEDVQVGELLMGPDSKPRRVVSTCSGREALYRVIPVKGETYVVNASHILSLKMTRGGTKWDCSRSDRYLAGKIHNIAVEDYLQTSKTFKHCAKGWRVGVDFQRHAESAPVDPYFLGVWLGDGRATKPSITTGDDEIAEFCKAYFASLGLKTTVEPNSKNSVNLHAVNDRGAGNVLKRRLAALGVLGAKHIPHRYRTGSREERLALLAGIIDTDGHRVRCGYSVIQKDERLFDDVVFLARSLGFAAYKRKVRKTCGNNGKIGTYFDCYISGDVDAIPVRLPRKKTEPRAQVKDVLLTGIKLEPIGEGEYFGFEIAGLDRLFLLGDFTVTHNTVLGAAIVDGALRKGNRVIFTVPALSLIDQTVQSFWSEGIRQVGVIQADHEMTNPSMPVQVASVQTLQRRDIPLADIVLIDEAHRWFKLYADWMARLEWQRVPFVGLTATPWTKGLGKHFDDLLISATLGQLIEEGWLTPFRVFAPSHPDLKGVKTVAGDYHEGQLAERMNENTLVADVVETWRRHGEDRPTLVFAVDRAHARHLQQRFNETGIAADYIDAYTDAEEREHVRRRFHDGRTQVVCNVGCLTTGVDWDVRCIVLARPTKSEMLYVQMIGRGLRLADGKDDCLILDHSDTTLRLGFVTDIHHDTLDMGKKQQSSGSERAVPLPKECPSCTFLKPAKVHRCPMCGFAPQKQTEVEHADGELVEMTPGGRKPKTAAEKRNQKTSWDDKISFMAQLLQFARERGRSEGWARHAYREFFGVWPDDPRVRYAEPAEEVSPQVRSWIRSRDIAFARGQRRQGAAA